MEAQENHITRVRDSRLKLEIRGNSAGLKAKRPHIYKDSNTGQKPTLP